VGAARRVGAALGPPGSALARSRLALLAALVAFLAWLAGPYTPWRLPGAQSLVPEPGQKLAYTVVAGLSFAAAVNALLCLLLLATSRRWTRDLPTSQGSENSARTRSSGYGRGWLLLLGAAAVAGVLRWPLAHQSLWWDEGWSVRKVIVGEWRRSGGEETDLRFDPATWLETLWYYRTPTNHVLYSAAARASLAGWRAATGAPREAFDEFALRFPAWLAAIASVILVGLFVRELGFPRAAPVAAWLLAVHPWHVRYGADGRGYSFVLLAALAGAWFLLRALTAARWRDALAFAATQCILLWTFPAAIYVPVALGIGGALACALGREPSALRSTRFTRLAIASLLAAMAFLQAMAPNLAQFALRRDLLEVPAGIPTGWARHLWGYLATGLQERAAPLPDLEFPTLAVLAQTRPWLPYVVYGVMPALALLGLARAWARSRAAERGVLAGIILAVPFLLLHRELQGFALIHRWAVFGLAATVPLLAIGIEGALAAAIPSPRAARAALPAALALAVAGFVALVAPQLRLLLTRPVEPTREVLALLARTEGAAPPAIWAGVGLGGDVPRVYDPSLREVRSPAELAALIDEARAGGKPLYAFYGYGPLNHQRQPDLFALLDDARLFVPIGRLDGIESETVFRVLRYTGKPLGGPPGGG
jgi:hypothetical protein